MDRPLQSFPRVQNVSFGHRAPSKDQVFSVRLLTPPKLIARRCGGSSSPRLSADLAEVEGSDVKKAAFAWSLQRAEDGGETIDARVTEVIFSRRTRVAAGHNACC
jgi:hypothetical protein